MTLNFNIPDILYHKSLAIIKNQRTLAEKGSLCGVFLFLTHSGLKSPFTVTIY